MRPCSQLGPGHEGLGAGLGLGAEQLRGPYSLPPVPGSGQVCPEATLPAGAPSPVFSVASALPLCSGTHTVLRGLVESKALHLEWRELAPAKNLIRGHSCHTLGWN